MINEKVCKEIGCICCTILDCCDAIDTDPHRNCRHRCCMFCEDLENCNADESVKEYRESISDLALLMMRRKIKESLGECWNGIQDGLKNH